MEYIDKEVNFWYIYLLYIGGKITPKFYVDKFNNIKKTSTLTRVFTAYWFIYNQQIL